MESSQGSNELPADSRSGAKRPLLARIALWAAGVLAIIALALFIVSFFLDGIIRPRIQAAMNRQLKGYSVTLGHAHLQLLNLNLALKRLVVVQNAHPSPPVANFPSIRFHLKWDDLFSGNVVAGVKFSKPHIHINRPQLAAEAESKTSLRQRGWQDAIEAAYPFKIDRLVIRGGDVTYIDSPKAKPLHLSEVSFLSNNIRNIREPNYAYPSTFSGSMRVFGSGRLSVDGRANYLMEPYPGLAANYSISGAPLSDLTTASKHVNVIVAGGTLSSDGYVEYSPKTTAVRVRNAVIDKAELLYLHLARTRTAEERQVVRVGKTIEKENNRPSVTLGIDKLEFRNSRLAFKDNNSDPPYTLFLDDTRMSIRNLSNHAQKGVSHVDLSGSFMGSGNTHINGEFVAAGAGPEFATNIAILKTNLTALNPLMRAYGRIDVAQGFLTVYSQIAVRNSRISGYVKPMFSDIKVYSYKKDKNKSLLQQAKRIAVGAAAHFFKNWHTRKVATQVNLSGKLDDPHISTWQAFIEVVRNAFVRAILPGFDQQLRPQGGSQPAKG
jgi:hypothetical protein